MQPSYTQTLVWSLLAGSAAAIVLAVGCLVAWQTAPITIFRDVRQAWDAAPVPHYRLIIQRPSLHCQQDVEIINEQIVQVFEHSCPIEMLTMSELLDRIAWLDGLDNFDSFMVADCPCESQLNATVAYDADTSYPTEVNVSDRRIFNWHNTACWRHFLTQGQLPECDAPFFVAQPRMTTISLIPLQ